MKPDSFAGPFLGFVQKYYFFEKNIHLWDLLVPKFGTQVLDLLLDPRTLGEASRAARPDLTPTISQGGVGEAVNIGQSKVSRFLLQHGGCHRDTRIVPPYLTSHSNYSFGAGKGKMLGPFQVLKLPYRLL